MMGLFKDELAGTTRCLDSASPRLDAYHDRTLTLVMTTEGARLVTKRRTLSRPGPKKRSRNKHIGAMVWRQFRSAR